jgi:hypothetical protein
MSMKIDSLGPHGDFLHGKASGGIISARTDVIFAFFARPLDNQYVDCFHEGC